jgi:hypothetical protein
VRPKVGVLVPAQLPPAPVGFTGRSAELGWLEGVLAADVGDATPVAVLSGPAGVGKTALAALWGHRVAARFPDGQLVADLRGFDPRHAPLDPGDVLTRFLVTLGVPTGTTGPRSTGPSSRTGGCWTTPGTPNRSGSCCPAGRARSC